MAPLKYSGSSMFRQRIVTAILANRLLKIDKIREDEAEVTGLQDFEANFLRLIEELTDGTKIEINETGTTLRMKPGILVGGSISHDCGLSRSIGWYIEGILPLALFCKNPVQLRLTGLTNDDVDLSMDIITHVTLPLLKNFGIYHITCKIKKRGMPPKGGGEVEIIIPPVRESLSSVFITDEGLIKRVRGIAFCTRVSPTILSRVVDSARGVLNNFLPDVHIHTDHYKGSKDGGDSPGYSLSLIAETSTGALLSVERTARTRRLTQIPGLPSEADHRGGGEGGLMQSGELPEVIGQEGAQLLLQEIYSGGVIDRAHQSLILFLMVLTPEDVSKVRLGSLTPQAIETLRILREVFGVVFRIKEDRAPSTFATTHLSRGRRRRSRSGEKQKSKSRVRRRSESEEEEGSSEEGESQDDHSEDEEDDDEAEEEEAEEEEEEEEEEDEGLPERTTYLLSCLGIGYKNVNRRVT